MSSLKSSSRSTRYRTIKRIRKENEELKRRIDKIEQAQGLSTFESMPVETEPNAASSSINASIISHADGEDKEHSDLSKEEAVRVILTMVTKHGLSKKFLPDLLDLTRILAGKDARKDDVVEYLKSPYFLMKAMEEDRSQESDVADEVTFHHLCEKCEKLFIAGKDEGSTCQFCGHERYDENGQPLSTFMEINPSTQIQDFFRGKFVDLFILFYSFIFSF